MLKAQKKMHRNLKNVLFFCCCLSVLMSLVACGDTRTNTHAAIPSKDCLRNDFTGAPVGNHRITPDTPTASQLDWTYCGAGIDSNINLHLQVVDGKAFVSWDNAIVALDAHTETALWTYKYNAPPDLARRLAFGNGLVYAITGSNTTLQESLCALDSTSGQVRWCYPFPAPANAELEASSPVYVDGVVAVTTFWGQSTNVETKFLDVFDASSGRELYQKQQYAGFFGPSVGPHLLYMQDASKNVLALDPRTGQIRWKGPDISPSSQILVQPIVPAVGNVAYPSGVGSSDSDATALGGATALSALDTQTGQERWHTAPGVFSDVISSPVISGRQLYFFTRSGIGAPDWVHALGLQTGQELWRTNLQGDISSMFVENEDLPIVGNLMYLIREQSNGILQLLALDTRTGKQVWQTQVDGNQVDAGPAIANGTLLLKTESNSGNIYADQPTHFYVLNAQTGKDVP
jgi:outer membrane protein assembly factor BamB